MDDYQETYANISDVCLCVGVLYLDSRTDILFEKLGLDWTLCFLHGHPWLYACSIASSMRFCVFSVSLASLVSVSFPHSSKCDACIDTLQSTHCNLQHFVYHGGIWQFQHFPKIDYNTRTLINTDDARDPTKKYVRRQWKIHRVMQ
jgi:hypothetical protein